MSDTSDKIALAALLSAAQQVAPELPAKLIETAYTIQKRRQFDQDRSTSSQEMQRLVDEYLNTTGSEPEEETK